MTEAELILQHVLNCSRSELYLERNNLLFSELQTRISIVLERRKLHEPLPHIFGKAYFHSREFIVDKNVLIPRPDTEILVETILENEKRSSCKFLEIGVGSGAISAILVQECPEWQCIGTDISFQAIVIAKQNCPINVHLVCADMFSSIKPLGLFDFIVSNPPYISDSEMSGLDTGVKDFEPVKALYGGKDGLDFYRVLAGKAENFLKPGGRLYCEIGYDQGVSAREIFDTQGWKDINVFKDLAGRSRVIRCNY